MKLTKRIICMLLSVAVILSMVSTVVFADERTVTKRGALYRINNTRTLVANTDSTDVEIPSGATHPARWTLYSDGELVFELVGDNTVIDHSGTSLSWKTVLGTSTDDTALIKKVVFPEGTTSIGGRMFEYEKTNLKEVVIPSSCTYMYNTFAYCTNLSTVKIAAGSKLETLNQTFMYTNITSIELPSTMKKIETGTFQNCGSLKNVTIGGGEVAQEAFIQCRYLGPLKLFGNTTLDKQSIVFQSENMEADNFKITAGPDVTISDGAVAYSYGVKTSNVVIYGVSGSSAESYAKKGFDVLVSPATKGSDGYFETTKKMNGENIVPITFQAFDGLGSVGGLSWIANDTVLTISGSGALPDQTDAPWKNISDSIRTIIIEEGVTSIGANAFSNLPNLKEVTLPESLTSIGDNAFANATRLLAVVIPDNVTSISESAFKKADGDTAVDLCIGTDSKLTDKTGYKVYAAGNKNETAMAASGIGWAVYGNGTGDKILVISGTGEMKNHFADVTDDTTNSNAPWKDYAGDIKTAVVKYGITNTTKHLLGSNRTGGTAYASLKNVILGDSITSIVGATIWDPTPSIANLEVMNLPYNLATLPNNFLNSSNKVKELFISKKVKDTGAWFIYNSANNVETLIFEEGFDGFNSLGCFFGLSENLKELVIPASVTNIPASTFARMNVLEKIEFLGNPTIAVSAFRKDLMKDGNAIVYCAKSATNVTDWAARTSTSTGEGKALTVVTYIAKGTLSNGMTWLVDGTEGNYTLQINGTGAMPDFSSESPAPWSAYASDIKGVSLDSGITSIGSDTFAGFSALLSITIPSAVTSISDTAFGTMKDGFKIYCATDYVASYATGKGFLYAKGSTLSNGVSWVVDGTTLTISGNGKIPGNFYADLTREVPWRDLSNYDSIETIIVEEGITEIPGGAFAIASGLKTIILPDSLKSLGSNSLNESDNLEFIEIPAGINDDYTGASSFASATELKRVAWLDTGSSLPNIKGESRRNAWTIYVPASSAAASQDISSFDRVTREIISANGKIDGTKIEWLVTQEGTLEIYGLGDLSTVSAAPWSSYASNINKVYIEEGITGVGANLFGGMTNNTYIELPDSVSALSDNAFAGFTGKVRVPFSVTTISDSAFVSGVTIMSYDRTVAKTYAASKSGVTFDERPGMRILAIGNSYTEDVVVNHLWKVAEEMGVEELKIGNLMFPGRSMEGIYNHIQNSDEDYIYREITSGGRAVTKGKPGQSNNIDVGLLADDWDVITLQPWFPDATNGLNGMDDGEATAEWLNSVVSYVKGKCPKAKLAFNLIWSQNTSLSGVDRTPNVDSNNLKTHNRPNYGNTLYNYNQIVEQVKEYVLNNSSFDYILPTGTAIENARTGFIGGMRGSVKQPYQAIIAGVARDGTHVNNIGMYIGAMTWVKTFFPTLDIDSLEWAPPVYYDDNNGALSSTKVFDDEVIAEAKWAAKKAVETANAKTFAVSMSDNPFRIMAYDNGKVTVAVSNVVRDLGYADEAHTIVDDKLVSSETKNGTYKVDNSKSSVVIVAEYDSQNKLVKATVKDHTLTYDEEYGSSNKNTSGALSDLTSYNKSIADTGFTPDSADNTIKVFLWDGASQLIPLAKSFTVK